MYIKRIQSFSTSQLDKAETTTPNFSKLKDEYKQIRAQYAYTYARSLGFTDIESKKLVAQVNQENGAWAEHIIGDGGCSIGMTQWNECARGPIKYKDWQGQLRLMIYEIHEKRLRPGISFDKARVSWNKPSVLKSGMYKTQYYYDIEKQYRNLFIN